MKPVHALFTALAVSSLVPAIAEEKKTPAKKAPAEESSAKKPVVKPVDGGAVEKKFIGKWAPDPKAMMNELQKVLGDDPAAAAAHPLIEAMMQNMAVSVEKGAVTIHAMGEKQTATYTITKVDNAANKLTLQITDDEGEGEGSATIAEKKEGGKTLTLEKDGEKFILNSITASEFEKRKNAAAQAPLFPGLE
ncbi:MAG: hypothetical protein P8M65_02230 [Roseibacillus sp.]|nr:hypothetical protein [Roseibacillus sp.]